MNPSIIQNSAKFKSSGRVDMSVNVITEQLNRIHDLGITPHSPGYDSVVTGLELQGYVDTIAEAVTRYPILRTSKIRPLRYLVFTTSPDLDPKIEPLSDNAAAACNAEKGVPSYTTFIINDRPTRIMPGAETSRGWLSPATMSGPQGVAWHELGHAVGFASGVDMPPEPPAIYTADDLVAYLGGLGIGFEDALSVSEYAAYSPQEAIGEFFAMWNVPGFRAKLGPILGSKVASLINDMAKQRS
jgi:hypothetical protein